MRGLIPDVLAVLMRRGNDFATAEDAVQDALVEAVRTWDEHPPDDPKGWLLRVAGRRLIDAHRSAAARRRREDDLFLDREPGPTEQTDDTLWLLFRCCHPELSSGSAVALTLRAVGGLTTREIAECYLMPEPTVAQRISRAKRQLAQAHWRQPGDLVNVEKVLYLIFTAGHLGSVDLSAEAIRLTRTLARETVDPEVAGLLALMVLTQARRPARTDEAGRLVTLDDQDRTRWDTAMITEGVGILRTALSLDRHGPYQIQAAITALHDDARTAAETDWPHILAWYDELVGLGDNPIAALNRAVALGMVDGPLVGLRALDGMDERVPRLDAVRAHLHERAGHTARAAEYYRRAADRTSHAGERDHLLRRAAAARAAGG